MAKKSAVDKSIWKNEAISLASVAVIGTLIAWILPHISYPASIHVKYSNVTLSQIIVLTLLSAVTVIYLAYFRTKHFFSSRWLVAAIIYNFLILFVKFTLSTNEFPKNSTYSLAKLIETAGLIGLLYVFGFVFLYLVFTGKIINQKLHKALITSSEGKVLLAIALFVVATLARIIVFRLPLLSQTTASNYVNEVFKTDAVVLSAVLFVICLMAVEAFAQVRRRDDLKYFFVAGLTLLICFHFWWAVFVYRGQ